MANRDDVLSYINQYIKANNNQEITGVVMNAVLQYFMDRVLMTDESGSNTLVQYSNDDGANWTAARQSDNDLIRFSGDGGTTWYQVDDATKVRSDIVSTAGTDYNTLAKIQGILQMHTLYLTSIQQAIDADGDDLQTLQYILDMIAANPNDFATALSSKLNTSTFNEFLEDYANDMANKADKNHTQDMSTINGLLAALAGKLPYGWLPSQLQIDQLGFYTKTYLNTKFAEIDNNMSDVPLVNTYVRPRLSVGAFESEGDATVAIIKLPKTDQDGIFAGGIYLSVYMHLFDGSDNFIPLKLSISANVSAGVWQTASVSADRISSGLGQVSFHHDAGDVYIKIQHDNLNISGNSIWIEQMLCIAANQASLIKDAAFVITPSVGGLTEDVVVDVFQPLTSSALNFGEF